MKICSIEGCNGKHEGLGYCQKHYRRFKKYGDPLYKSNNRKPRYSYEDYHKEIDDVIYKLCSECNDWHPMNEEYFYKNNSSSDGYFPYCKKATKKRSRKWAKDNPEQYLELCRKDNKRKDRRLIFRNSNKRRRERGYYKDYYANNKSKFSEYGQNRRNKTHDITDEEWENCKNYFNYRCAYCDLAIEEHYITYKGEVKLGDFHKEHVIDDGANDLSNCVPSCKTCNSSKHLSSLDEWYNPDNDNFSEERLNKVLIWLSTDYFKYINNGVR